MKWPWAFHEKAPLGTAGQPRLGSITPVRPEVRCNHRFSLPASCHVTRLQRVLIKCLVRDAGGARRLLCISYLSSSLGSFGAKGLDAYTLCSVHRRRPKTCVRALTSLIGRCVRNPDERKVRSMQGPRKVLRTTFAACCNPQA